MLKKIPVVCSEQNRGGKHKVDLIELTRPEALNALNTECYKIIEPKLKSWSLREEIAAVVIYSSNEKAFCAGGDVKSLVLDVQKSGIEAADEFFTREYFVDYFIHQFKKPIIAIADGITMGGGLGLIHGASHRLVTERTVMAMPEISIGLFPDVGATHFLAELPHNFGLFMGLTGARITGADAVLSGLADYIIPAKLKSKIISDILGMPWVTDTQKNKNMVSNYLSDVLTHHHEFQKIKSDTEAKSNFTLFSDYAHFFESLDYFEVRKKILNQLPTNAFFNEARSRFIAGSPLSKQLFFQAYHQNKLKTLQETFVIEWEMAVRACQELEFLEGVRAVLIDKDNKPQWHFKDDILISDLPRYFQSGRKNLLNQRFSE